MKNIFKNNKGFTLIELLAVVAVLGVLLSITLYVTMDVVDSARRKSYEVTLNNVEKHAGTYVYENSGKIFFLNSGAIEYQCVKVQDLIDMGYLNENVVNSPISSSSNVTKNSYVYIERNASTKTITKSIYDFAMNDSCSIATSAKGDITFSVSPDLNKWAKEKEVKIAYRLKDSSVSHSYTYMVSGAGSSFTTATQNPQPVTVTESGTVISAKINDGAIAYKSITINKIDKTGPVIKIDDSAPTGVVRGGVTLPIIIHDNNQSGVNYKTVSKDDFKVTIAGDSQAFEFRILNETTASGKYEIKISNCYGCSGTLKIEVSTNTTGTIYDNVENPATYKDLTAEHPIEFSNNYTITLNKNGATNTPTTSVIATYNSSTLKPSTITLPEKKYTVKGFTLTATATGAGVSSTALLESSAPFKGWWTTRNESDGTIILHKEARLTFAQSVTGWTNNNSQWIRTQDATLYAQFGAQPAVTLPTITKTGYTCGWTTAANGSTIMYISGSNMTPTENTTLYGVCTANTYTVKYYQGNNSTTAGNTAFTATSNYKYDTAKNLTTYATLGGTPPTGWVFAGWSTTPGGTTVTYTDGQSVNNLATGGTINLYAVFSRTVRFYHGVNKVATTTSTQYYNPYRTTGYITAISAPAPSVTNLSDTGWSAIGYRADTTASDKAFAVTTAAANITPAYNVANTVTTINLYAVYSRTVTTYSGVNKATTKTYTQYYNSNNTVSTITDVAAPTAISNWTSIGYVSSTLASYTTPIYAKDVTTMQPAYNVANKLYAIYSRTLTISYNGNGSTGGTTAATTKTIYLNTNSTTISSQTVTLASNGFSKIGYTFNKWAVDSTSGTQYAAGANYTPTVAYNAGTFGVTMYATWSGITYTVAFDKNGGTGTMNNQTNFIYGTEKALTANAFTRTGYTFNGWNTKANGSGTSYADKAKVSTLTSTSGGTVTLYAQWKGITYTVAFDKNGGTGTMNNQTNFIYGTEKALTANAFTRTGYTFNGWNTKADGSGTSYADKAKVSTLTSTNGGTVTLYAQWKANPTTTTTRTTTTTTRTTTTTTRTTTTTTNTEIWCCSCSNPGGTRYTNRTSCPSGTTNCDYFNSNSCSTTKPTTTTTKCQPPYGSPHKAGCGNPCYRHVGTWNYSTCSYDWSGEKDNDCCPTTTTSACTKKCPDGYAEGPYQCFYSNPHSGMGTCHCTHQNLPVEDTPSTQSECTAQSNGYGGRVCSWTPNGCPNGGDYKSGYCYYYHDFLC